MLKVVLIGLSELPAKFLHVRARSEELGLNSHAHNILHDNGLSQTEILKILLSLDGPDCPSVTIIPFGNNIFP